MANKKSVLTLVLESYQSSCRMMAELKDESKDAFNALISTFTKSSHSIQLSMFRNILMNVELAANEVAEVELILKQVEAEHTNKEVLESVQMIRTKIQQVQPAVVVREG